MSESATADRAQWIKRMLGMPIPLEGIGPLQVQAPDPSIDRPGGRQSLIGSSRGKARKTVKVKKKVAYDDAGIAITRGKDGIVFKAPPPPLNTLNFAGGGGKGTALYGAAEALMSGAMDKVTTVNGASVGAITSALLASGITLEELQPIVDNTGDKADTVEKITDGTMGKWYKLLGAAIGNRGSPLTGEGVREVVAGNMDETVRKRIAEYQAQYAHDNNGARDKVVDAILDRMDPKLGPTFQDMRDLSRIIPKIKEISVTGTYTQELDLSRETRKGKVKQVKSGDKNDGGQSFIFNADTVPAMPVALAVQASAAFPVVFKPVDIDLSDYMYDALDPITGKRTKIKDAEPWKVRFVDGGVMNNMPTQSSIGNERPLDPIPQERSLSFAFQGSASATAVKQGELPHLGGFWARVGDRFKDGPLLDAKNWAAEYALSVDAQEHAKDFVVVPLKFTWTKEDGEVVEVDMSGTVNGTLEFDPDPEVVAEIRKRTKEEAETVLDRGNQPATYKFANGWQMVMSIGMDQLKTLKDAKPPYPHAGRAWDMRTAVADRIKQAKAQTWPEAAKQRNQAVATFLSDMDKLALGKPDCAAYIAREIHKANLDYVIDHAGDEDVPKTSVGGAVGLVNEAKQVFAVTTRVLKTVVYPKMRDEKKDGASFGLLQTVSKDLRGAVSWDEVAAQFDFLVKHYRGKSDKKRFVPLPGVQSHGHKEFYKAMKKELAFAEKKAASRG